MAAVQAADQQNMAAMAGQLAGRHIVIGVTGSIAAYKAVDIVSRLKKRGADVHVILTREAAEFVTPLTFREISGQPVAMDMWAPVQEFRVEHIALAQLADLVLVAPATANILAKAAHGIADDMLSATLLATKAPVWFAPAMNTNMYEHAATQHNMEILRTRGCAIIEPAAGHLACGTSGKGRLPEPADIVETVARAMTAGQPLKGRKVLVTAGGTIEPIDPVRFIGNHATGRMGYAVAAEAAARGAEVVLISGPSELAAPAGVRLVRIQTAREMREAVLQEYADTDLVVKSAAVADYRPIQTAEQKIKKSDEDVTLHLTRNPDILYELGQKKTHQVLVGFAAETQNVEAYARAKLEKKNLDFIVANDVSQADAGFGTETNRVTICGADGRIDRYPLMSKRELAGIILDHAQARFDAR